MLGVLCLHLPLLFDEKLWAAYCPRTYTGNTSGTGPDHQRPVESARFIDLPYCNNISQCYECILLVPGNSGCGAEVEGTAQTRQMVWSM